MHDYAVEEQALSLKTGNAPAAPGLIRPPALFSG
jgi:hypothetical protein